MQTNTEEANVATNCLKSYWAGMSLSALLSIFLVADQGQIQGVSRIFIDTANVLGKNWKKINIYYYYPIRKGQVIFGNYFNVFKLVG